MFFHGISEFVLRKPVLFANAILTNRILIFQSFPATVVPSVYLFSAAMAILVEKPKNFLSINRVIKDFMSFKLSASHVSSQPSFWLSSGLFPALRDTQSSFSYGGMRRRHGAACFAFLPSSKSSHPIPVPTAVCFPHFMQQYRHMDFCFAGHTRISHIGYSRWQ
jgi:hypothetical protein